MGIAAIASIMAVSGAGTPATSVAAFAAISVIAGIGELVTVVCAGLARGEVRLQK